MRANRNRLSRSWDGEELLTLSELAKRQDLPIRRAAWSWRRWAKRGVPIEGTKRRLKLPTILVANIRHSSVEAVRDFIRMLGGPPE